MTRRTKATAPQADLAPTLIGCGPAPAPGSAPPGPEAIGFKAYNLARMAALGLSVPPAFVLGTAWCNQPQALTPAAWQPALQALEAATQTRFGDPRRPLLLSVRSGAPISMPGMMETLLNIGLCDATVPGLLRLTGNPRLAWDAYRRLVAGYGEVVLGVSSEVFEADLALIAAGRDERELDFAELRSLTRAHLASVQRVAGRPFPQAPAAQLAGAIQAVFSSWQAPKARDYRRMNQLADTLGTAVTVQRMVFGNAGGTSGAGVGFTRHPSTGEPQPWVDFLFNAQGEDVVSGRRSARGHDELAAVAPGVWAELLRATAQLERALGDMQDFEFTVENGHLWLLQTRNGKRTPQARARIALDLCDEGVISREEALHRTEGLDAETLSLDRVVLAPPTDDTTAGQGHATPLAAAQPLAHAVSAAHGVAVGEIALDEARARQRQAAGVPVLLVRHDAETSDIVALDIAAGLLTVRGARTSHAAVVARQLGKVCLVGCDTLHIDLATRTLHFAHPARTRGVSPNVAPGAEPDDTVLQEGDVLTLDGHQGAVWLGAVRTVREAPQALLSRLAQLRA